MKVLNNMQRLIIIHWKFYISGADETKSESASVDSTVTEQASSDKTEDKHKPIPTSMFSYIIFFRSLRVDFCVTVVFKLDLFI